MHWYIVVLLFVSCLIVRCCCWLLCCLRIFMLKIISTHIHRPKIIRKKFRKFWILDLKRKCDSPPVCECVCVYCSIWLWFDEWACANWSGNGWQRWNVRLCAWHSAMTSFDKQNYTLHYVCFLYLINCGNFD